MGHTPFGYRIKNGKAVINANEADTIRQIYNNYLSGMALVPAAKAVGLAATHASVKRMMKNRHYLGDDFYPAIIDPDTFDKAGAELAKRAAALGRENRSRTLPAAKAPTQFFMREPTQEMATPLLQAEYLYSLIERKVMENGTE